jgi:hypothetical protein
MAFQQMDKLYDVLVDEGFQVERLAHRLPPGTNEPADDTVVVAGVVKM